MFLISYLKTMTQVLLLLQTGFVRTKETPKIERENTPVKATLEKLNAQSDVFVNEWAVRIPGGPVLADAVAKDLGYDNAGQVDTFVDISVSFLRQLKYLSSSEIDISYSMLVYQSSTEFYSLN